MGLARNRSRSFCVGHLLRLPRNDKNERAVRAYANAVLGDRVPRRYLANSSILRVMKDDGASASENHWYDSISFSASDSQANVGQLLATYMMPTANCCVKLENNCRAAAIDIDASCKGGWQRLRIQRGSHKSVGRAGKLPRLVA